MRSSYPSTRARSLRSSPLLVSRVSRDVRKGSYHRFAPTLQDFKGGPDVGAGWSAPSRQGEPKDRLPGSEGRDRLARQSAAGLSLFVGNNLAKERREVFRVYPLEVQKPQPVASPAQVFVGHRDVIDVRYFTLIDHERLGLRRQREKIVVQLDQLLFELRDHPLEAGVFGIIADLAPVVQQSVGLKLDQLLLLWRQKPEPAVR